MAVISLNIPTLVQHIEIEGRAHYHLHPLFTNHPVATHRRFEGAVNRLQQEIKDYFKGFKIQRKNADHLLWFYFNPRGEYKQIELDLQLGREFMRGLVSVFTFRMQGMQVVCLPAFKNFAFIVDPAAGTYSLKQEVSRVVIQLFKEFKALEEDFNPKNYFAEKREFLTEVNVKVKIEHSPFKMTAGDSNWFQSMFGEDTEFDGAIEIEKVGYDLNGLYPADLQPAFYMEDRVEQLYRIIYQSEQTPIALVGPEGTGRHTLVHEIVRRYLDNHRQKNYPHRPSLWHIDPSRIIAGMSIIGMWQKRFEAILHYVRHPSELHSLSDKILIDNPVALLRIGRSAQNNMTLSDVLKPYLEKRQLQLTLIATPEEWKVIQEKDRRFSDLFQVIRTEEPDFETAVQVILQKRRLLEIEHDTVITIQAIEQLLSIHRNFLRQKALPGGIIKLLQRLCVKYRSAKVDVPEVRQEFQSLSGLQSHVFDAAQGIDAQAVSDRLRAGLVGQSEAVEALSDVVHLIRARLTDPKKPISSFLFIGPTGVGKTQAAKVLANYLSGSEDQLIRFDMNEYIDEGAAQRLIGDYYQPEGQLTGKVRYQPFGILLLDEIEKAHPLVHDLLLQLLDDGRLTDSLGRTVDFSNIIVIMTSNLGAREVSLQLGYRSTVEDEAAIYRKAVEKHFRPEFINRIDRIVIFDPLELDHILRIARLQIRELLQRDGFVRRTTILNISSDALEWVARRGFDARMGGRALKRQIERDLTALSAEQLIATSIDHPILMDIHLEGAKLIPSIRPLRFAAPLPEEAIPGLPDGPRGHAFYSRLLRVIEETWERIVDFEEQQGSEALIMTDQSGRELNWLYYHFKNKVVETREQTRNMLLGFRDRYFNRAPAIPLRLKRSTFIQRRPVSRGERENLRDRLFQEEGLQEISEAYQFAAAQFDSLHSEFIDHYLNVAFLLFFAEGLLGEKPEPVSLHFRSLITGMGRSEIEFLIGLYQKLFQLMDLPHKADFRRQVISLEGYALGEVLAGEAGIHLFYLAHRNPLPVQVSLEKEGVPTAGKLSFEVIRVYDGTTTMTDLRTGYSNVMNISENELKFLLYAGIDPDLRARYRIF